jgi:GDPmannose 4,6-dehydratase
LNCINAKVFITGSALQFQNKELPIDENIPFEASSPYSVARIQSTYAARYYRNKFGMNIYIGYLFNHDSPLRKEQYVNQHIVKTIKRIHSGSIEKLEIGNIEVKKEFNFAADLMEAVWILVNQNNINEAVIGSGKAYSIEEWIEYCFNKINKKWQDHVIFKTNYQPDYKILTCNPRLIKSLGWKPNVSFYQLADLMMGQI